MEGTVLIPILLSIVALIISIYALIENRRIIKWTTSYSRLSETESLIIDNPGLLKLHGVTEDLLKNCETNAVEVVYLLSSLRNMQEIYRLNERAKISPYLKEVFKNRKVVKIWKEILLNRFVFRTNLAEDIDKYIVELEKGGANISDSKEFSQP